MDKVRIKWRNGSNFSGDPQVAYNEIRRLEKKHGECRPEHLITAAKRIKNPLHKYFEWDDSVAAQKYRLYQARTLIRSITVIYSEQEQEDPKEYEISAWSNLNDRNRRISTPYERTIVIITDDEKRTALLAKARKELKRWRDNYAILQEFAEVFKVIDAMELQKTG